MKVDSTSTPSSHGRNPFFYAPETASLTIEAARDSLWSPILTNYRLPDGREIEVGLARVGQGITPVYEGYDFAESLPYPNFDFVTMTFVDVDGDGRDEMIFHTGDGFFLQVYRILEDGTLKLCGGMESNFGFFITSDHIMVSRMGSQGSATIARLTRADTLEVLGDYIDKLLMSSERYDELEYEFKDTAEEDRALPKLFQCPENSYIICDHGSIWGDHAMHFDIDGDGIKEILYIGNSGWGMTSEDAVRLLRGRESYNFVLDALENNDPEIVTIDGFDLRVKESVQVSVCDTDGNGRKEVVVSFGQPGNATHFIYRYRGKADLTLLRLEHK